MGWITQEVGADDSGTAHSQVPRSRMYAICILLLLASAINYMDRQTLANVGKRITDEFRLEEAEYGWLETSFGLSFAAGSLFFGFLADVVPIRFLYPIVLLMWSLVGFLTGYAESYEHLLGCRALLGFFEAGHWPCGLKTTQALLAPGQRAMGNSVLQSGTSIGAIVTPIIMLNTLTPEEGSWRFGFQLVGAIGMIWLVGWFSIVRGSDFVHHRPAKSTMELDGRPWWYDLFTIRMAVVLIVVTIINASWQIFRGWLPKIMQQDHDYSEVFTSWFTSGWYAMTDVGCLASGALTLYLVRSGRTIRFSRAVTFGICATFCSSMILVPFLQPGLVLLVVFLISGAGALGMFPIFYSLSQDISKKHQGKVTGVTGIIAWTLSSPTNVFFGWLKDTTNTFSIGLAIAGGLPMIAWMAIVLFWPKDEPSKTLSSQTR